ncbi:MAG: F0F1 ATP synthase subunit gamma [Alphaproteobacteria bacterium]|nr:F0F1 ATP synthase subunit gamma [Alphaproteobacteria bacterium]MCB9975006.1 F0F1 ATP synthase subunit gamma [Rhodospirillales bacterium]
MPSLRDYRDRIKSVKSTRKITSAMKMVAASKLRRAQEQAEASQPYAVSMSDMLARLAENVILTASSPKLLAGTGSNNRHLLVLVTADRGLCGGFNAYAVKMLRQKVVSLKQEGKDVSIICVGRKGRDIIRREYGSMIIESFCDVFGKNVIEFSQAHAISDYIRTLFDAGKFDVCSVIYNEFKSVLTQTPTTQQLIPFRAPEKQEKGDDAKTKDSAGAKAKGPSSPYSFEPGEEEILSKLLPRNLSVQIYRAMLDSSAGEQAARMTAMDNATRNAGDMINALTLQYNRARQAYITKELIEIISGAEAV